MDGERDVRVSMGILVPGQYPPPRLKQAGLRSITYKGQRRDEGTDKVALDRLSRDIHRTLDRRIARVLPGRLLDTSESQHGPQRRHAGADVNRVQAAPLGHQHLADPNHVLGLAEIGSLSDALVAAFLGQRRDLLGASRDHADPGTARRILLCYRVADAAGRPQNQDALVRRRYLAGSPAGS